MSERNLPLLMLAMTQSLSFSIRVMELHPWMHLTMIQRRLNPSKMYYFPATEEIRNLRADLHSTHSIGPDLEDEFETGIYHEVYGPVTKRPRLSDPVPLGTVQ